MNLNLKSTVSILALTLCFAIPNALSMDSLKLDSGKPYEEITVSPSKGLLNVEVIRDTFPDSGSVTFHPYGEIKTAVQKSLSEATGHIGIHRILELDGGGIRGLFSIIQLTVLEEIANHPMNKDLDMPYRYIRDLFDVGTGTSTGSILTAGLFSKRNYSATDVAKLYARYGYKIFDEHKRTVSPGVGIGLTYSTYGSEGLQGLLVDHFGNSHMQDVHKPIYIVAMNETKQEAAIFSSNSLFNDQDKLHKTPLVSAVLCSSSAPTFFPAVSLITDGGQYLMSDGGTVANNPASLIYDIEISRYGNPFEIYSFGTGLVPSPETRGVDSGGFSVATILGNTLVGAEKLAYASCIGEINKISSQLQYFARMNPKLEMGMDKLDDTTDTYIEYAIQKAFSLTQGRAFADMVTHLGFQMPNQETLAEIQKTIRNKLDSLKSNQYDQLDKYEKEFVIKKVLDLDFMFYQKRYYQDSITGQIMQMQNGEAESFLIALTKDIAFKKQQGDGFVSKLWNMVSTSNEDNILEFIPRCLEFHKLCDDQVTLTLEDFSLLTAQECAFTQAQLKILSPSPKYTINGEGLTSWYASTAVETDTNTLVLKLFTKFTDCCDDQEAQYKYGDNSASYGHLPALIFWKDTLKNLEGHVTKEQLVKLKTHLAKNAEQVVNSRSYTRLGSSVRSSRFSSLVMSLDTYIEKFCKS